MHGNYCGPLYAKGKIDRNYKPKVLEIHSLSARKMMKKVVGRKYLRLKRKVVKGKTL